jgi:hypothetical protein
LGYLGLHEAAPSGRPLHYALILVLVKYKYIEPGVNMLNGSLEFDVFAFKCKVQPLVFNVAQAIQGDSSLSFLEQDRSHLNLLYVLYLPKVIEIVIDASLVK